MDEILLLLLKKRAHEKPIKISTTELAQELGMSQQNISRRLIILERSGRIERAKNGLAITNKGMGEVYSLYAGLKTALRDREKTKITGKIVSGIGDGKYYLSLKGYTDPIKTKLGFVPYPGTLNLKLDSKNIIKKKALQDSDPVIISSFKMGERTLGAIYAYPCTINNSVPGAIILPLRTHHGADILEVISSRYLRKKLNKKDGDRVVIEII